MGDSFLAQSAWADFPSLTWTFHVPSGTPLGGGMYRITYERPSTDAEINACAGLPGPKCPHCGKDTTL